MDGMRPAQKRRESEVDRARRLEMVAVAAHWNRRILYRSHHHGPLADRFRYATFAGLIVSLLAWIGCTVCSIVGAIRFAKSLWVAAKARPK